MLRTEQQVRSLFANDLSWFSPTLSMSGDVYHINGEGEVLPNHIADLVTFQEPIVSLNKNSELYQELLRFYGTESLIKESIRAIYENKNHLFLYVKHGEQHFSLIHDHKEEVLFVRFLLHGSLSGECKYFKVILASGKELILRAHDKKSALGYVEVHLKLQPFAIKELDGEVGNALFNKYFDYKPEMPTLVLPTHIKQNKGSTKDEKGVIQ